MLSLRQSLYLSLDDLLYITRQYIHPDVSRSGIARLLKREGMARLEDVIPKAEGDTISTKKTFKDYELGSVHVDIKYLPQMPDETSRRYLFVAIDRATRWVFLHIYGDMTDKSSVAFMRRLKLASPIKIMDVKQKRQPAWLGFFRGMFLVARGGIEPPTQGCSILSSNGSFFALIYGVGKRLFL